MAATSIGVPGASAAEAGPALPATSNAPAAAGCGSEVGPQLNFDGLGHFVVTVGFSGAKRATAYAFTEYISVENSGHTKRYIAGQHGTLFFRSSLTKRYVGNLPPTGPTTITVIVGGTYTVANIKVGCVVGGYTSGGAF
jgi:hypothetical protein